MSIRNLHILILVSVAYVAAQLVADISNLRDLTLFGLSVSAFSIAYPLTFTLRDMAHNWLDRMWRAHSSSPPPSST